MGVGEIAELPDIVRGLLHENQGAWPRILHVEDDPDVVEVVRQSLQLEFSIDAAPSLERARTLLASTDYHLVVLDLTLADGRGTELIPALVNSWGARIPTVVFTAEDPSPALRRQVRDVLTKSRANLATLVDAVRSVLREGPSDQVERRRDEDEQAQSALRR
jgi:DNA-binding response OmpR family regulator